ncbi:MAG: dTDP-glucose 4,6-dehydratase [Opitutaceae bacterium]|jgi:dTDP-glucose 4,6-dehydratase|nr:dTDP-glucose 4,6-dehydratase [Opitutaceae bacterium]
MRLLVTGGCGFIGSHFLRHLLRLPPAEASALVVNLDALTYAADPAPLDDLDPAVLAGRYHFVHGDITDRPLLDRLFAEHAFDAVVHLAAESHVDRSIESADAFVHTNILGTQRLLDAARAHLATRPPTARAAFRFLHVSTDEVYGSLAPDAPAFTETSPLAPNSPYAASKASADLLVRAAFHTHGLPAIVTRCSNNYGPRQFPEKLIPLLLLNALEHRPLPLYGDGLQIRDWLHVADHAEALWLALRRAAPGSLYHFGGHAERTNLALALALCTELDRQCPRADGASYAALITHVADRPGHDRRYAIDASRARADLGWQPRRDLPSGLAETVAWYLQNRPWCAAITATRYARQRLGLAP